MKLSIANRTKESTQMNQYRCVCGAHIVALFSSAVVVGHTLNLWTIIAVADIVTAVSLMPPSKPYCSYTTTTTAVLKCIRVSCFWLRISLLLLFILAATWLAARSYNFLFRARCGVCVFMAAMTQAIPLETIHRHRSQARLTLWVRHTHTAGGLRVYFSHRDVRRRRRCGDGSLGVGVVLGNDAMAHSTARRRGVVWAYRAFACTRGGTRAISAALNFRLHWCVCCWFALHDVPLAFVCTIRYIRFFALPEIANWLCVRVRWLADDHRRVWIANLPYIRLGHILNVVLVFSAVYAS